MTSLPNVAQGGKGKGVKRNTATSIATQPQLPVLGKNIPSARSDSSSPV